MKTNLETIKFHVSKDGITIKMPTELLVHVAKHHPDYKIKVLSQTDFLEELAFELANNLGQSESGLTGFQELIDEAILGLVSNGSDCIETEDLT